MRSKFTASLFVLALLMPVAVIGAETAGPYASFNGTVVMTNDSASEAKDVDVSGEWGLKAGFGVVLAGGYAFGNGVRTELEFGYRKADLDSLTVDDSPAVRAAETTTGRMYVGKHGVDSEVTTISLMANAIYVFQDTGLPVLPYVGAGVGWARHDTDEIGLQPFCCEASDTNTFAWQFMAGVKYPLDAVELGFGYRLMGTSEADFDDVTAEYMAHNFELGVTFRF